MDKRLGHKKPSPVSTTAAAKERKKIAFQITSRKSAMTNPSAVLSKKGHGSSSSGSSDSSGSDSESSYSSSSSTSSREKVTSTSKSGGGRREKAAPPADTAAAKTASKKGEQWVSLVALRFLNFHLVFQLKCSHANEPHSWKKCRDRPNTPRWHRRRHNPHRPVRLRRERVKQRRHDVKSC
jgi:hypothetical protein